MKRILVVGLAMVLAAAGNARADGANGQSSTSSATSGTAGATSGSAGSSASAHSSGSGAVAPARSSGSGSVQQGAVASRSVAVPAVRNYPGNINVQRPVHANPNTNVRV